MVEEVTQLSQVHFKLITPWVAVVSIRVHTFFVFQALGRSLYNRFKFFILFLLSRTGFSRL